MPYETAFSEGGGKDSQVEAPSKNITHIYGAFHKWTVKSATMVAIKENETPRLIK